MQDLCHATRYIRTSSNPMGGILINFSFKFLVVYFFMCFFIIIFVCCLFVFFVLIFCVFL